MFLSWTAYVNSCKKQCEIIVIQLSGKILNCSARNTNLKLGEPVHDQKNQQTEKVTSRQLHILSIHHIKIKDDDRNNSCKVNCKNEFV